MVQVPYENYRKVFRTSQKHIEKDFGAVQTSSKELAKQTLDGSNTEDTVKAIDGMINRVENLKRKVNIHSISPNQWRVHSK